MAANLMTVELWVLVDENGDHVVARDQERLAEVYAEDIGESGLARRVVKVLLTVPYPEVVELAGMVPADRGKASLVVQ